MTLEIISRTPAATVSSTPLLFVHGAWHGAWCWDEFFLPYFADKGYQCHALSLRGHAGSAATRPMNLNGVWDYVADVAQVADEIEKDSGTRPAVIGHSMGGYIVQKYLERHTVPAAVLVASIPVVGTLPFNVRLLLNHPIQLLLTTVTLNAWHIIRTPELARQHFFSKSMSIEQVERYHARMNSESLRILLDAGLIHRPRPKKIHPTPLLVTAANNDQVFTVKEEENTAHAYNATLKLYPDMAHDMMLEPGWQQVADDIIAWLAHQGV